MESEPVLFCKEVLFIHVPKTAGTALTEYLLRAFPRPIFRADPFPDQLIDEAGIKVIPTPTHGVIAPHETMAQAAKIVRCIGLELRDFPVVLAVLRNPYELEVSRYTYLYRLL